MNSLDNAINAHLQNLKVAQQPPPPAAAAPTALVAAGPGGAGAPGIASAAGAAPVAGAANGTTLSIAVDGLPFRYRLTEPDLRDMFARWGQLQNVHVNTGLMRDVGVVTFADRSDAADAQKQLHGFACILEGAQGMLQVIHGVPEQLAPPLRPAPQQPMLSMLPQPGPQGLLPAGPPLSAMTTAPGPGAPGSMATGAAPLMAGAPSASLAPGGPAGLALGGPPGGGLSGLPGPQGAMPKMAAPTPPFLDAVASPSAAKGAGKGGAEGAGWRAKVVVRADLLHHEFPTASKIAGANGQNVEHISTQTRCTVQLRGVGSGTLEVTTGQEAQEPMYLTITCEGPEQGSIALEMVQDLLRSVYEEHAKWCSHHSLHCSPGIEPATTISEGGAPASSRGPVGAAPGEMYRPAPTGEMGKGGDGKGVKGRGPY